MNDIPDWAGKRACELLNAEIGSRYNQWPDNARSTAVRTVAKLVMQHETKPVDPDEQAVKRIFVAYWGNPMGGITHIPENLARAVSQYKQEKGNG